MTSLVPTSASRYVSGMTKATAIVARDYSRPSLSGQEPAFTKIVLPGGEVVHVMNRALHERALAAAQRKMREVFKDE